MEKIIYGNIKLGQGKVTHAAYYDQGIWWTKCGADHQTNRGQVRKIPINEPATCKKCLKY